MILRALFLGASLLGMTPIMVTCQGASGPAPSPTPTLSPTATPTSTPTATPTPTSTPSPTSTPTAAPTIAGLAPAAYSGLITPSPTSVPSTLPTILTARFYNEIAPNSDNPVNPWSSALTVAVSGGADITCVGPYLRTDSWYGAANGSTGAMEYCQNNSSTTAENVTLTPNQGVKFTNFETLASTADNSTGFCYTYTALAYNDYSLHNCSIGIAVGAGSGLTFSGANQMLPGSIRFISMVNSASTGATPTPVPLGASPTPLPSVSGFPFNADFPARFQAAVNAVLTPAPYQTPLPVPTGTTIATFGGPPGCFETSPPYRNVVGRAFVVTYCPDSSPNPTATTATVTAKYVGGLSFGASFTIGGPTPSPTTTACYSPLTLNQNQTAYGILCIPAGTNAYVVGIDTPPTPNPSPTFSPYPGYFDSTCGQSGTYASQAGGPFPPASRQCFFLHNAMVGIVQASPAIDPNDADYMANSGIGQYGAHALQVSGVVTAGAGSDFATNWVNTAAPFVQMNVNCSGTCATMSTSQSWFPTDTNVGGAGDCHLALAYYAQNIYEDWFTFNGCGHFAPFTGNTIGSAGGATRLNMQGDGMHSLVTASTTSSGIGMIKSYDVLDTRVSTFPTGIQIAAPCTSASYSQISFGTDGGIGSNCGPGGGIQPSGGDNVLPPNGSEIALFETPAHIVSCNLDILSQKYWLTAAVGFGHGLWMTDTNGGAVKSYYIQSESDRDWTRFGVASGWQVVAAMMGVAISGDGSYSLPISTGGGCINTADLHFISPSTPNVPGTTLAP